MKKIVKSIVATFLLTVVFFLSLFHEVGFIDVKAETVTIEFHGYARYGGRSCGKFTVNGEVAFCMQHYHTTPSSGMTMQANPYDNDLIKTILYYGWGGPGNIFDDEDEGIVRTSFALHQVYTGDKGITGEAGAMHGYELAQPLLDIANSNPIKDMNILFDKTQVEGKRVSAGHFQTEEIFVKGDIRNTLTFHVPESVTMHNVTENKMSTGTVTVKGGDTIYFTSYTGEENVSTGELAGSMEYWQALLLQTIDQSVQNVGMLGKIDPPYKASLDITWVSEPEIGTKASDVDTGMNQGYTTEQVTIKDAVSYKNLIPGKEYTVKGVLMEKETEKPLLVDGKEVVAEKVFIPSESNGTVELTFTFNGSALSGKTVVVFEKLFKDGVEVTAHEDITDENQTVRYLEPEIHTKARDAETEMPGAYVRENMELIDEVAYKDLIPGKEYTVKGVLMDKETGKPLLIDRKEITAEKTFTSETSDGTVEVVFTFNGSELAGKSLVVFEKLYYENHEIAAHEDIEDMGQTITIKNPEIHTKAHDAETEMSEAYARKSMELIDEVAYKDLILGKEYTVKGVLMDKETGKPLLIDGKEITVEKTFTAETSDGTVEVVFTFNGSELAGKSLVVFEKLYYENHEIAFHEDIEDKGQTITIKKPEIHTKAHDKGSNKNVGYLDKVVTLVDVVNYKNLIPGKEYTVKGVLMDKETGKPLLINGKEITAEKTFTAETSDGNVELEFTFDGSVLNKKTIVVFEKLYYENREIAAHEDIEDEDQTVSYEKKVIKPVKTGDSVNIGIYLFLMVAAAVAFVFVIRKRKLIK